LLERDVFRTAVRFALMNGFREDSPVITSLLQDLYRIMPSLFSTLLTESESCSVIQALDRPDEDEALTGIESNKHHVQVAAVGCPAKILQGGAEVSCPDIGHPDDAHIQISVAKSI